MTALEACGTRVSYYSAFSSASLEGLSQVSIDVLAFEENTGRRLEVGASDTGLSVVTSESSP